MVLNTGVTGTLNVSGSATLACAISGAGALRKTGAGTLVFTGANTAPRMLTIAEGTLTAGAAGALFNSATVTVADGATLNLSASQTIFGLSGGGTVTTNTNNLTVDGTDPFTFSGTITNTGNAWDSSYGTFTKTGSGTLTLDGATITGGEAYIEGGSMAVGYGTTAIDYLAVGTGTANTGSLTVTGGTLNIGVALQVGDWGGIGTVNQTGGTVNVQATCGDLSRCASLNIGNQGGTGTTTISAGTLQIGNGGTTGSVVGDIVNNANLVFNRSDTYTISGAISGNGTLTLTGGGTAVFGSSYSGQVTLQNSTTALVAGSTTTATFVVNAGGVLGGSATIAGLTVNSGGVVAPGYSPGTLTVNGPVAFNSGAIYSVDVTPEGAHDLIVASGNVTISSGATVKVVATAGIYDRQSQVTILTTSGTVTGTFGTVSSNFAFLRPTLTYDLHNVYLDLVYSGAEFVDYAQTPNQAHVAVAAQALGEGNAVFEALLMLPDSAVAPALNQLTGEIYPSVNTVIQQESVYLRDAVGARLRQADMGTDASALGYAAKAAGPATAALSRELAPTLWAQGYGAWGDAFGNGNAATISSSIGGFLGGVDAALADNVRGGVVTGYSRSTFAVDGRSSSGSMDNVDLGVYLGAQFGALGLRGGASYSWHDIDVERTVAFPGFAEQESASYMVGTTQIFGEAGYRMAYAGYEIEPFVGLAYVGVAGGSASESWLNAAGLAVDVAGQDTFYSTVGARMATSFEWGGRTVTPSATLGWQHAFGDTDSTATMRFLSGTTPFEIQGVPIAQDTLLVGAGLAYGLSDTVTLQLNYAGQIAAQASQNAFSAQFSVRF